jgi:hypothetical protein
MSASIYAKTGSLLYFGILVGLEMSNLTLWDPLNMYRTIMGDDVFEATPAPVLAAAKHLSFVHGYSMILQAFSCVMCVYYFHQAKSAMCWLAFFCFAVALASDILGYGWPARPNEPEPLATIGGYEIRDDIYSYIFLLFGGLAVVGYQTSENGPTPTKPSSSLSKGFMLLYLAFTLLFFTPNCVLDPSKFYLEPVGKDNWESTPEILRQAMMRLSYMYGIYMITNGVAMTYFVFDYNKPKPALFYVAAFWLVNIVPQCVYPWPDEKMGGNALGQNLMFGAIVSTVTIVSILIEDNRENAKKE